MKQTSLLPETEPRLSGDLMRRTFTVRANEIRAALLFASNDETRFVLNSVRIEVNSTKPPVLIATDGRRLAAIESVADQGDKRSDVDFEITVSTEFLKPLCAFAKSQSAEILFEFRPQERLIAHFVGGKIFVDCEAGAIIAAAYPNWRMCLPVGKKNPMPCVGLNAEFVGDFAKAAKFLDVETPIIAVNLIGESQALEIRIDARPTFYGVLMPAKVDDKQNWQPEFLELIGYQEPEKDPEEVVHTDDEGDSKELEAVAHEMVASIMTEHGCSEIVALTFARERIRQVKAKKAKAV